VRGNKSGKREKPGKTYPAEGPNTEKGRTSMISHDTMNPNGGVHMRRVVESFDPNDSKGPWRLSRTLATQTGMTNQWLKDQGLLSVKELWVNIHYPATAS